MDSTLLRAFLETADAGSVSGAARALGISQPSLTLQIQRFEQRLGARLFQRHGRGVAMTDAGKALYPRARRILEEMEATAHAVRRESTARESRLRVGAIPTIAPYVLPDALRRVRARDAELLVELREDFSAVLAKLVHDDELDVAIAALPYDFDALETEVLGTDRLMVAVPSTFPAARAGRITLQQLREAPTVWLDPAHCLGEQVAGFCSSHDVKASVVCRSSQLTTVLELVGAGVGLSIVPGIAAARHNTPQCTYVPLVDHELQRDIVAVWKRGAERSGAAQSFVACVREVVRGW